MITWMQRLAHRWSSASLRPMAWTSVPLWPLPLICDRAIGSNRKQSEAIVEASGSKRKQAEASGSKRKQAEAPSEAVATPAHLQESSAARGAMGVRGGVSGESSVRVGAAGGGETARTQAIS